MKSSYDKYYQTENLFGNAYPELLDFFKKENNTGSILDIGCGQGRDAVALARLGFKVEGIDNSKVGIDQMIQIAEAEKLNIEGSVVDIFEFDEFKKFDYILLDSMFHFLKNDLEKETGYIMQIIDNVKTGCKVVFCIQDSGKKVDILKKTVNIENIKMIVDQKFQYTFIDSETNHSSKTNYRLVVIQK